MKRIIIRIISLVIVSSFVLSNFCCVFALDSERKYLNYDDLYLQNDKYEVYNRKIFNFNLRLNKIFLKKVHLVWFSIFPRFVIDGLNNTYSNIEYPKRFMSCLLQRDFDGIRNETKRFVINTTIGLGGFIDAANKFFKLELYNEDMEQAFAKCKVKCGNYLVLPFISSTNSRDILGRIFDFLLTPTTYIASPVAAAVKLGLLINRTANIQPILKMVESSYIDPYDIARKIYGLEKYIKLSNFDRKKVLENFKDNYDEEDLVNERKKMLNVSGVVKDSDSSIVYLSDEKLLNDIYLDNYNPQSPIIDSMRTAAFSLKNKKSFWNEMSIWNRDFSKKIKTSQVNTLANKEYKFRYAINKSKASPLAMIFPSVGEGINSSSAERLAEILYLNGYSIVIIGSQFQWEFAKALMNNYKVGLINKDIKYINNVLDNIIVYLSQKYNKTFLNRIAIGTSLGAYTVLFLADKQYQDGGNNFNKFIAISPPFELIYAVKKIDEIIASWKNYPNNLNNKIAYVSAKIMRLYKNKSDIDINNLVLPFSNYEAKLISGFVFHQKISDLIFVNEVKNKSDVKNIYNLTSRMDYLDYIKKYFGNEYSLDEIKKITSLFAIQDYLINKDNYVIYEGIDDYLLDESHLRLLKQFCGNKIKLVSNGAHLGYMYRKEFQDDLIKEIKILN